MNNTIAMRARQAGKGLEWYHKVVTDELLDYLAERFLSKRVREMTHCTFEQYTVHPEAWERIAGALQQGYAVRYDPEFPGIALIIRPQFARAN